MKYLKIYEEFGDDGFYDNINFLKNNLGKDFDKISGLVDPKRAEVYDLCNKYKIVNKTVNKDLTVDVNHSVDLISLNLDKIPIKFGKVNGHFNCSYNNLKTLENSPNYVNGNFICSNNKLETLEGSPKYFLNYFFNYNNLKDFYGFPENISSNIHYIRANGNPVCEILNLIPPPPVIKDTSNDYRDFMPRNISYAIWPPEDDYKVDDFKRMQVKFIQLLNEYHVIRNGNTIIQDRLEVALEYIGIQKMRYITFDHYSLV